MVGQGPTYSNSIQDPTIQRPIQQYSHFTKSILPPQIQTLSHSSQRYYDNFLILSKLFCELNFNHIYERLQLFLTVFATKLFDP